MAVTVPTLFDALAGNGGEEYAGTYYIGGDYSSAFNVAKLSRNAMWLYAKVNRRVLAEWGRIGHADDTVIFRNPLTSTAAAYETIFEVPAAMSANTAGWSWEAHATNASIRVSYYNDPAMTSLQSTRNDATAGSTEATIGTTSGTFGSDLDGAFKIEIETVDPGTAQLYFIRVWENDLATGDLP